jgi:hypothetical protein
MEHQKLWIRWRRINVSLVFVVIDGDAGGRGEVDALEQGCWSEVVDLSLFPNFVGGMQWFLVQCSTGTFPGRRATSTCALLHAAGMFIDSQSLVGDGASLDLAMVEAHPLFQRSFWRCWSLAAAGSFGECRKA